jgi:hypothetical protein
MGEKNLSSTTEGRAAYLSFGSGSSTGRNNNSQKPNGQITCLRFKNKKEHKNVESGSA